MKRLFGIAAIAVISLTLHAEDAAKAPTDAKTYLDQLQVKLEHTARRVNQPTASGSSVVGLRGSKQTGDAKQQLYWKSKTTEMPVTPEEVKAFRSAVEMARAGEKAKALAALKTFDETYPKSGLKADVLETQRVLTAN